MSRRARPIIRDDLVMRYARVRGLTFGGAWDIAETMTDAELRDVVENLEAEWTGGRTEKWTGGLTR